MLDWELASLWNEFHQGKFSVSWNFFPVNIWEHIYNISIASLTKISMTWRAIKAAMLALYKSGQSAVWAGINLHAFEQKGPRHSHILPFPHGCWKNLGSRKPAFLCIHFTFVGVINRAQIIRFFPFLQRLLQVGSSIGSLGHGLPRHRSEPKRLPVWS